MTHELPRGEIGEHQPSVKEEEASGNEADQSNNGAEKDGKAAFVPPRVEDHAEGSGQQKYVKEEHEVEVAMIVSANTHAHQRTVMIKAFATHSTFPTMLRPQRLHQITGHAKLLLSWETLVFLEVMLD